MIAQELFQKLAEPIEFQQRVKTFYPKGKAGELQPGTRGQFLAYIDARDVYNRLDEVVGPENWQTKQEVIFYSQGLAMKTAMGLRVGGEWIWREDVGYPNSDQDEEPLKSAASDGVKRAAVQFGVGRFLYDLEPVWLEVDKWGKPLNGGAANQAQARPAATSGSSSPQAKPAYQSKDVPQDAPCEVEGCDQVCAGKFIDYSKRTYNRVLCASHSAQAKRGELALDPKEHIQSRSTVDELKEIDQTAALKHDVPFDQLPDDDFASLAAQESGR